MPSATFVLKEPKSKDNTLVYLLFRYQNQTFKYSTGQKIEPKFWSFKNQRARETKQFKQHIEFNALLQKIEDKAFDSYRKLTADIIVPTKDRMRKELNRKLMKGELAKQNNFINFIDDSIKNSIKRPNTVFSYKQTFNQLVKFKAQYKREMTFENIDLEFYDDFMKYCLEKNYSPNTIGTYIKVIKMFMNEALDKKLTDNMDFKSRRFKKVGEESENIYLTEAELSKIYKLNLSKPKDKTLAQVRDVFIIGCYTGLRYADLFSINSENLFDKNSKLRIKTEKTGELVIIPLHSYIKEIIKKHGGIPQYKLGNQTMNESLKDIGEKAGLKESILISSTQGGVVQTKPYKKYELIGVHTARRSFATNAYLKDIPTISIMKITGHKTEKSFLKYIKISQQDNANKLTNHPFFN